MAGAASTTLAGARDLPEQRRLAVLAAALAVAACAGFAALAGTAALWLWLLGAYDDSVGYAFRLAVKTAAFAGITGAAVVVADKGITVGGAAREDADPPEMPRALDGHAFSRADGRLASRRGIWLLAVPLLFASILAFPRLHAYPWTAPDELHHLIVARNLAEHDAYASGHPDSTLTYFDYYDSVGPTVLGPIAGLFRLFETDIGPARAVIGGYFLLLLVAVYAFIAPMHGGAAALISALFAATAAGSVYLARSVYGEVPAMTFFIVGLLAWRRQLTTGSHVAALGAGVCLGLAAMTKLFIAITGPAFLLVWWYDRRSARRISTPSVALMSAGAACMWLIWTVVEWRFRHLVSSDLSPIVYYRHMLLFGFESTSAAAAALLRQPFGALAAVVTVAVALPQVLRRNDDAPALVLLLSGLIFGFWWLFFSSGHIPRYLWYFWVIAAVFAGPVLRGCVDYVKSATRFEWTYSRVAFAGLAVILVAPTLVRAAGYIERVYGYEELGDEIAMGAYLTELPPDAAVATTWWPAERSANFFAHRVIIVAEPDSPQTGWLIRNAEVEAIPEEELAGATRIGRYAILPPTTREAD